MNIQELVMHSAQLVHVETVRFQAEKKSAEVGRELHIIIKVSNNDFFFEEEKVGLFRFNEKITDKESAIQFMEIQGVRILSTK